VGRDCTVLGWSATLSAPLSSQLAAVLAGFVFTSIVFLISSEGRKHARALGLFCAAFVILGFDSHLFSVLTGSALDTYCSRVWTEAVAASGLLVVGAMAIIAGIIWLLPVGPLKARREASITPRSRTDDPQDKVDDIIRLNGIVLTMAYGVSVAAMVLLAATVENYLDVVRSGKVPTTWSALVLASPVVVGAVALAIALWRRLQSDRSQKKKERISTMALQLAAYGILAYALIGTVFVGLISNLGNNWWQPASKGVVVASITLGLFIPGLLLIALIHAIPQLSTREARGNDDKHNADRRLDSHRDTRAVPSWLRAIRTRFSSNPCQTKVTSQGFLVS
jgi:hypothetical protein